jgi:hypothetical protein
MEKMLEALTKEVHPVFAYLYKEVLLPEFHKPSTSMKILDFKSLSMILFPQ